MLIASNALSFAYPIFEFSYKTLACNCRPNKLVDFNFIRYMISESNLLDFKR